MIQLKNGSINDQSITASKTCIAKKKRILFEKVKNNVLVNVSGNLSSFLNCYCPFKT